MYAVSTDSGRVLTWGFSKGAFQDYRDRSRCDLGYETWSEKNPSPWDTRR